MEHQQTPQPPIFSQAAKDKVRGQVGFHSHPGTELILVTRGSCVITMPDIRWTVSASQLLVVPAETPHDQNPLSDDLLNSFIVLIDHAAQFDDTARLISFEPQDWCIHLFQDLCAMSEGGHYKLCCLYLPPLITAIQRHEQRESERSDMHPALIRTLKYLDEHLTQDFDIASLAHLAGVSRTHLRRLFDQQFHCTPQRHVQNLRMAHARELLLNPSLSVKEVARDSGYPDCNYFTRLFHKLHHCTPQQFRLDMRNRPDDSFIRM